MLASMPENSSSESPPRSRLRALVTEWPSKPIAKVRWAWTDINSALNAGHSVKVIHQRLCEDGLEISYRTLARYVHRFRMEGVKKLPSGSFRLSNPVAREPGTQTAPAGNRVDPLASAIEALSKGRYSVREAMCDGDPTKKKLI
jgi:hypothetical protein